MSGADTSAWRQQHASLHAARQRRELRLAIEAQTSQNRFDALIEIPALCGFDALLQVRNLIGDRRLFEPRQQGVVARQPVAEIAEPGGDHFEDAARCGLRHLLRQPRDAHAGRDPTLAFVGADLARNDAQQGRLAGAIAAGSCGQEPAL
jgi:hypothetical protein